ncbi:MAG: Uma2 family endonuclease, partial [Actinomycetota bacterium]
MAISPTKRRFNLQEYHRMLDAQILTEDDRVELIDGEIVEMTPSGARHAETITRVSELLRALGPRAIVREEKPIVLDDRSEPEPDIAVLLFLPSGYTRSHPVPRDVYLLVEVAATSAKSDRRYKIPRYARSGIGEVWLVDLVADRLETYKWPLDDHYTITGVLDRSDRIAPDAFSDL